MSDTGWLLDIALGHLTLGRTFLLEAALAAPSRNRWAQHWYRRFVGEESDSSAWSAFQLFLRCADGRFWLWKKRIEKEGNLSSERQRFFRLNKKSVESKMEKQDKKLEETLFGYKKIHGRAWPWAN